YDGGLFKKQVPVQMGRYILSCQYHHLFIFSNGCAMDWRCKINRVIDRVELFNGSIYLRCVCIVLCHSWRVSCRCPYRCCPGYDYVYRYAGSSYCRYNCWWWIEQPDD